MAYHASENINERTLEKYTVSRFDTQIFILSIVDIFFLPYIRVLSVSLSMILIPFWFLINSRKIKFKKEFQLFFLSASIIVGSLTVSRAVFPHMIYFRGNLTNAAIILLGFLYYFFFKYYFQHSDYSLRKILGKYLLFGFLLAFIYFISPQVYFNVRSFWTLNNNAISVTSSLLIHRFTSTFSDPNNASVIFVGIATYLLLNKKADFKDSLMIITATIFILVMTMSSTGFVTLGVSMSYYIFRGIRSKRFLSIKQKNMIYLAIFLLVLPVFILLIINLLNSNVAQTALERVSGNSANSRVDIWRHLLTNNPIFQYIFFGTGGTIIVNGKPFPPHNGHFHLIYNYGMIVYATFMYVFFRKKGKTKLEEYFFLVPIFLGFTMNVGIYEPRFMFILALLAAEYTSNALPYDKYHPI